MTDENTVTLTDSENAFFESGGETAIVEAQVAEIPVVENAETAEPTVDQARDEKGKFIPHAVFHAEREEHKKTKTQLEELSRKQAVLEDRWDTLLKVNGESEPVDEAPPNPDEDIFAFSRWQAKQLEKLNAKVTDREKQEQTTKQAQEQDQAIWSHWQHSRQAYAAEKPDFDAAATYLAEQRDKQISAYGVIDGRFKDKAARDAQINAELKQIILAAGQQGINPADAVYQIAMQYGFTGKPPEEVAQDPGKMELSEKLGKVATAMEQSKTIGQTTARSGTDALSAQAIADMPAAEFEAWMKAPENANRFKTMMGG